MTEQYALHKIHLEIAIKSSSYFRVFWLALYNERFFIEWQSKMKIKYRDQEILLRRYVSIRLLAMNFSMGIKEGCCSLGSRITE